MRAFFRRSLAVGWSVFVLVVSSTWALAQVAEDRPRLVLNPGGPAGPVWKVAFSPDSRALYAGGADKLTHLWHLRHDQGKPRASFVRSLHWEIARGYRGVVYAMDVSPKGDYVAIAGVSARQGGDIILFDTATGEISRSLPPVRDNATSRPGHLDTVVSLAFSLDGQKLVSVDKTGEALLWTAPNWTPATLRPSFPGLAETQLPALFLDANVVALGTPPVQGRPATVALYDVRFPDRPPQSLPQLHPQRVTALARDPQNERWASSDGTGAIFLWSGLANPQPQRLKQGERIPTSLAFGPDNLLAVGNALDGNQQTVVELWDLNTGRRIEQISTSSIAHNPSVAFSPDGQWFATHSPSGHEVYLYSILKDPGQPNRPRLFAPALLRLRGRGQVFRSVVFEQGDSYRIGMSPNAGEPPRSAFDLRKTRHYPNVPGDISWRAPDAGAGGWTLTPGGDGTLLLRNGGLQATIALDRVKQGVYSTHAWVADAAGRAVGVAIGTDEQNAVFVYVLPQRQGDPVRLARYFRDHSGTVTSLAVSSDGLRIASASEDQTIKIWSLADLLAAPPISGWGCDFTLAPGGVVVGNVRPEGIAAGRGLQNGDLIARAIFPIQRPVNEPQAMLAALRGHPLFEEVTLETVRAGQPRPPRRIVPAWEPMATLFVDRRSEWAIWTPEGYYDSSAAQGDDLFAWQINRGPGTPPRIVKAANLRREFERPDLLQKLFALGDLPSAFVAANQQPPADFETAAAERLRALPEVRVLSPSLLQNHGADAPVRFVAEAQFPAGQSDADYVVHGSVDGIPLGEPIRRQFDPAQNQLRVEWERAAPDPLSHFRLKIEKPREGRRSEAHFAETAVSVTSDILPPATYRMHVLAMAASKYPKGAFPPLQFPKSDATTLIEDLKAGAGRHYSLDEKDVTFLTEDEITKASVQEAIATMKTNLANADRNDLLIVFIAGHGHATAGEYYFIPISVNSTDAGLLARSGVSWTDLAQLTEIGCRKLVLFDTCRSGDILDQKASIRPLRQAEYLVVASTSAGGTAFEGPQYNNHGAFTNSLDIGIRNKMNRNQNTQADGIDLGFSNRPPNTKDGDVSLLEMVEFAKRDVVSATGNLQFPTYTPVELVDSLGDLPLFRPGAGE